MGVMTLRTQMLKTSSFICTYRALFVPLYSTKNENRIIVKMKNENRIFIKTFDELTNEEVYELLKIRFEVFVMEQGCHYLDPDGVDYSSVHIFMKNEDGSIAACTRLFAEEEQGVWHVGRVIANSRGKGVGKIIMDATTEEARRRGARCLRLEGQVRVIGFYEKCGYRVCSEPFDEAGIPHVKMEMKLQ